MNGHCAVHRGGGGEGGSPRSEFVLSDGAKLQRRKIGENNENCKPKLRNSAAQNLFKYIKEVEGEH